MSGQIASSFLQHSSQSLLVGSSIISFLNQGSLDLADSSLEVLHHFLVSPLSVLGLVIDLVSKFVAYCPRNLYFFIEKTVDSVSCRLHCCLVTGHLSADDLIGVFQILFSVYFHPSDFFFYFFYFLVAVGLSPNVLLVALLHRPYLTSDYFCM